MGITLTELEYTHELDISWIIALWRAIHGGDPGPEAIDRTTAALAGALAAHLAETARSAPLTAERLTESLGSIGVEVRTDGAGECGVAEDAVNFTASRYCYVFQGQSYCVDLPRPHGPLPR
jgi:hypothetical protein